jgi:hypothetical protein
MYKLSEDIKNQYFLMNLWKISISNIPRYKVQKHFSTSIVTVRSRGGSLLFNKNIKENFSSDMKTVKIYRRPPAQDKKELQKLNCGI